MREYQLRGYHLRGGEISVSAQKIEIYFIALTGVHPVAPSSLPDIQQALPSK
jgi:hypothetical protein